MAEIHILYRLSIVGQKAALLAGKNAGAMQTIILRSPGHDTPEAPTDVLARVLKIAEKMPEAPPSDAKLADVAKALTSSILILAQSMDPTLTRNLTVEEASPDLWEMATKMAITDKSGVSSIRVNHDNDLGSVTTGFSVRHDTHKNIFQVEAETTYSALDRLYMAEEILTLEKIRRENLSLAYDAACMDAEAQKNAYNAAETEKQTQRVLESANRFLEQYGDYASLPEVIALRSFIEKKDFARNAFEPENNAETAVRRAKEAATLEEKKAWVKTYGSERTQRLAKENLPFDSEYQEERLHLDMPGWKYGGEYPPSGIRPPTLGELRLLDTARAETFTSDKVDGDCVLRWVHPLKEYRPGRRFMGRQVYYSQFVSGSEDDPAVHTGM